MEEKHTYFVSYQFREISQNSYGFGHITIDRNKEIKTPSDINDIQIYIHDEIKGGEGIDANIVILFWQKLENEQEQ